MQIFNKSSMNYWQSRSHVPPSLWCALYKYVQFHFRVYEIEKSVKTPEKYLFPNYETVHWYATQSMYEDLKGKRPRFCLLLSRNTRIILETFNFVKSSWCTVCNFKSSFIFITLLSKCLDEQHQYSLRLTKKICMFPIYKSRIR